MCVLWLDIWGTLWLMFGHKSFGFQIACTKCVIGDPSYFPDKVKKVGLVYLHQH